MLTGRPPFKGTSMMETLHQVVYEEVVPPSRFQSKVSRDLETICLKCLAKEPSRRYATAGELADDLGHLLAGETILARRTPRLGAGRQVGAAAAGGRGRDRLRAWPRRSGWPWRPSGTPASNRREDARVAQVWRTSVDDFDRGRQQRADGDLNDARATLTELKGKLNNEPRLADLRDRAVAELSAVDRRLAAAAAAAADRQRYNRFGQLRDEALQLAGKAAILPVLLQGEGDEDKGSFAPRRPIARDRVPVPATPNGSRFAHHTARGGPRGLPTGDRQRGLRHGSAPGLAHARAAGRGRGGSLSVADGPVRGRGPPLAREDPRRQADAALRLLDRAEKVREQKTAAYHLRRAACLEQLGDDANARLEHDLASRLQPETAFDHFLLGRERFVHGDWAGARNHFEKSLRLKAGLLLGALLARHRRSERRPAPRRSGQG